MATVALTPEAAKQYDRLPVTIARRVRRVLTRLKTWPDVSGARPLRGRLAGHYRIRTGDYRLQFRVEGEGVIRRKNRASRPLL